MKILIEFFAIVLFFVTYKFATIYEATAVLMAATVVQTFWLYKLEGKLTSLQWSSFALIIVFGSLTLFFHDDRFIKFKPTLLYSCMALGLMVAQFILKKNFLKSMLGAQVELTDDRWHTLSIAWILYCFFMAALNTYVASYYTTEQWVDFKIWGYVFPLIFIVSTGFYIAKHAAPPKETAASDSEASE